MPRINLVDPQSAPSNVEGTLSEIKGAFGVVPNMFRAVGNSSAALNFMWGGFGALGEGKLGAQLGEKIAVAIANKNACAYCLAAHSALGQKAGASSAEMTDAQLGRSADPKTQAALTFALKVVENRGQVTDRDVEALKSAGFDNEAIMEIVAHIALNLFTNYVNVALDVPVDFPSLKLKPAA